MRSATESLPAPRSSRVQSVERAAALLRAVAESTEQQATVAALAQRCSLNRATAWRILTTLKDVDLLACDPRTGRWSVGPGMREIAGTQLRTLIASARPSLARLCAETGETAALAMFASGELGYVEEATPASVVAASWQSRSVPLHATSTGKTLLAFLPEAEARALVGATLHRYTDTTLRVGEELWSEVAEIRLRGYGTCRGEYERSAYGVSAPVLDPSGELLALVSVWGPRERIEEDRFAELGEAAVVAAAEIARRHATG